MSIAFSPQAYGQLIQRHTTGGSGTSYATLSGSGLYPVATGGAQPAMLSTPMTTTVSNHQRAALHTTTAAAAGNDSNRTAYPSTFDRQLKELLEAAAPVPFEASDLAAAEAAAAQQAAAGVNAKPLGTPSASDSALCAETMLANAAETLSARDLLLQSLPQQQREQLKELQRNWKNTAMRGGRTSHAVLFLCLQPGGDPPDHPRISPRAKLEGWIDPSEERTKLVRGSEAVLDALESQYRSIHKDVLFKRCLECHVDEARQALQQMRKKATESGRLLVHYNGHGMPPATAAGEIWFYDRDRTHFVPMHVSDIVATADSPTIYVLDCNSAASVLAFWKAHSTSRGLSKDVFLCACGEDQRLPTNPVLPADFFTACLTTPLRAALVWYAHYSDRQPLLPTLGTNLFEQIPGDESNKKTPRGELAFILSTVADTVAWCTVDPLSFNALFRQDVMLKGLLRNFLLADRLMRETGCVPRSHPALPYHAHLHPAWQAWDVALEGVLSQLPALLRAPGQHRYTPSPFWKDQLSSFEVGLAGAGSASDAQTVPEQLPCVVLALGQSLYRHRALVLLSRFFEQGARAVHHGFACGVIGYIVRLLANPDLIYLLLGLWLHVLRANHEVTCAELIRARAETQLIAVLAVDPSTVDIHEIRNTLDELPGPEPYVLAATTPPPHGGSSSLQGLADGGAAAGLGVSSPTIARQPSVEPTAAQADAAFPTRASDVTAPSTTAPAARTRYYSVAGMNVSQSKRIAAFLLCAMIAAGGERTAIACWNGKLANAALAMTEDAGDPECVSWGCLLLGRLCEFLPVARERMVREIALRHALLLPLLQARHPGVRASCVSLLATLLCCPIETFVGEDRDRAIHVVRTILDTLLPELAGVSTEVRVEVTIAAFQFVHQHREMVSEFNAIETGEFIERNFMAIGGRSRLAVVRSRLAAAPGFDAVTPSADGSDATLIDTRVRLQCEPLTYVHPGASIKDHAEAPPAPQPLSATVKETLRELVHDASLMCHAAMTSFDSRIKSVAGAALSLLRANQRPLSARIAREGHRIALAQDRETQHAVSDQERTSERRNEDLMRQSLLRAEDTASLLQRVPGPATAPAAPSVEPPATPFSGAAGSTQFAPASEHSFTPAAPPAATPLALTERSLPHPAGPPPTATLLPFTLPYLPGSGAAPLSAETRIVSLALRQLEPHLFAADAKRNVFVINYEKLRAPVVVEHFQLPDALGRVAQLHIVNDLASSPMSLAVGGDGIVIVHRGLLTGGRVQDALTFNAAAGEPLPPGAFVTSAYRGRDGVLFFGGVPHEVRCVSLAQEVIEQTLVVPGEGQVTAMSATASELLLGKDDGTVKIFDTRQDSRYLNLALAIGESQAATGRGVNPASTHHPRVIHACRTESSPNDVFIAQRSVIKIYDVRKRTHPKRSIDLGGAAAPLASFAASRYLPLMAGLFTDGAVLGLTCKGQVVFDDVRVAVVPAGPASSAVSNLSGTYRGDAPPPLSPPFAVHPHRPILATARELVVLTPDESRLVTSLAI